MPIYEQTPIRLQVILVGNPPVTPLDQLTGSAPKFWRGAPIGVDVGIFDAFGDPVDLSNLASLSLSLFRDASALVPIATKTIAGVDLYPMITSLGWANGTQANATFDFTASDTDQTLDGQKSADYWIVLEGVTNGGASIIYAAGVATIFLASSALPISQRTTPTENEQSLNVGNITVTPASNIHLEVVTVGGSGGRTSNIVVGQAGLTKGARVDVLLLAQGAPAAIDVQFFLGSLAGANPFAFNTSGGTTRALFRFYFDGAALQPLEQVNPAF